MPKESYKLLKADPDDPATLPRGIRRRSQEDRQTFADAHNERWRIVETCPVCKRGLVAEEVRQHRLNHLSSSARRIIGSYDLASPEVQAEVKKFLG